MGNPNAKSRKEWISQHFSYLPKTTHGFNKNEVILDYNWRLSHQGNLSKYWGSIRRDQKTNILNSFFSNRRDVGKSSSYEVIMKRELLLDILDNLPPLYQIIGLFLAYTGLRLSDALECLVSRWGDLQYIRSQEVGRYYIPNVITKKRNNPIYFLFISKELIDLLNFYLPNNSQNKILFLLKKSKSFFENKEEQIRFLKRQHIKELKKAFKIVKDRHPYIKPYQVIRTHLLRKYFITHTNLKINLLRKELNSPEDYLLYLAGHRTLNPLYIIYDQSLRDPQINLVRFVNYIEPSVAVGFAQKKIKELTERKKEIANLFRSHFGQYIKERNEKNYFSCIDISTFFNKYQLNISWEELSILVSDAVQQGIIQPFGSYFSFHDEETINGLEKHKVTCFIKNFPKTEREGIKFYELCKFIHYINMVVSENEFLSTLKKLKELKILFEVNNRFKLSKLARISS
jgi:integrase